MRTSWKRWLGGTLGLALLVSLLAVGGATAQAAGTTGAVYVQTNATTGNAVQVFDRAANGALTAAGTFATGGTGTGVSLGSQGSVLLSSDARWLFVVNAGSNQVSSFKVEDDGLELAGVADSGGVMPISVTAHGSLLYVVNAGDTTHAGNISGLTVGSDGSLTPLANSTQPLSGMSVGPAQVSFSPDGTVLVVTEKTTNLIDTFVVGSDGRAHPPVTHASVGNTPFGFAFDPRGQLIVSDAAGGQNGDSALSSYKVHGNHVQLVTGPLDNQQLAACWVVVTKNGRYAYTTNAASGTISGLSIGPGGTLTLLDANGITGVTGTGSSPQDMGLSSDGRFLYSIDIGTHAISAFRVRADGSLVSLDGIGSLIDTAYGLAAR